MSLKSGHFCMAIAYYVPFIVSLPFALACTILMVVLSLNCYYSYNHVTKFCINFMLCFVLSR